MKKKRLIALCIIILIVAGIFNLFIIQPRILSKNFKEINSLIFIPQGIADQYKDYMMFSFDDYRIWEYNLTEKETALLQAELDNGIWQTPTQEEFQEITGQYFNFIYDGNTSEGLSENCEDFYYCLYNSVSDQFIKPDEGWAQMLFLYDTVNNKYVCVFFSI